MLGIQTSRPRSKRTTHDNKYQHNEYAEGEYEYCCFFMTDMTPRFVTSNEDNIIFDNAQLTKKVR